jgi:cytochrome c oxidase subunit 3
MTTTVHERQQPDSARYPAQADFGGHGNVTSESGSWRAVEDRSPASRTGIWVGLAAITMTFAAFTSAMVVRQGSSTDWRHFALPSVLYLNTAILLTSSVTLELARQRVRWLARGLQPRCAIPLLWLYVTLGLGWLFVVGQYAAWLKLRSEGLYLATSPSSSFFYLFTAIHAIHVLGGLAGLMVVVWRFSRPVPTLRLSTVSTVSYYWHFMDLLWVYLLFLLWTRI